MKDKKALKKLEKVETLLSDILDRYPGGKSELADLLRSAKAAAVSAKKSVSSHASAGASKKGAPAGAKSSQGERSRAKGTKKVASHSKNGSARNGNP